MGWEKTHHLDHINIQLLKLRRWPSLTPPGGKAAPRAPKPSTEGRDDLRELALLSSLASMGHWEVALQCLSFPSRPGPGGDVWWAGILDSREVLGVTVSCLLYKVLFNETQGLFLKVSLQSFSLH